jgi:hypothetical protein
MAEGHNGDPGPGDAPGRLSGARQRRSEEGSMTRHGPRWLSATSAELTPGRVLGGGIA